MNLLKTEVPGGVTVEPSVCETVQNVVGRLRPHLVLNADALAKLIESEAYGACHLAGQGQVASYELPPRLFPPMGIHRSAQPVSSAEFRRPARRPRFAVLSTIQSPAILLPPRQEGVKEYAAQIKEHQP